MMKLAGMLVVVCLFAAFPIDAQFKVNGVINAADTPRNTVFLTYDDGSDEAGPDGLTQMQKVAKFLHGPIMLHPKEKSSVMLDDGAASENSIRATFAVVTCHFIGSDRAAPNSSLCQGYGDVPETIATHVVQMGHDLMNHSVNHIPLTSIQDPAKIIYEATRSQQVLDRLQDNSPRLLRGPGLAFDARVAGILNSDPYTAKLIGPLDTDVGGAFLFNGSWIGGDWDCFDLKIPVHTCGALYVDAIRAAPTGVVVLLHVRTENMTGRDGNPYALALTDYIVGHLGGMVDYLPLDAIPGVLGRIHTGAVQKVSVEFGPGDGQGDSVAGAILGKGKPSGICKARNGAIWCKTADGVGGFLPATPWMAIQNPTWFADYNSKFWLTDLNGDGRADLVFPTDGTLNIAYNNGQNGFYAPQRYFSGALPDTRFIHFGKFNGDALSDMVVWTDLAAPRVYINNGVGFVMNSVGTPASAATVALQASLLPTLQFADINSDGLDDLVFRGTSQIQCSINTGHGFAAQAPCSTLGGQFSDSQGWTRAGYRGTFAIANINGPAVVGGLATGVIFAPTVKNQVSDRYRFLCNTCYTNSSDPAWKPTLRASQIVWGDFDGSGNDSPCFVRNDGLYLGLTQIGQ